MVPGSDVRGTAGPSSKAIPFIMYTKDALRQELFWWQELENAFVCTLTSISLWSLNVASSSHCFIYTFFSSLDEDENTQPGCKYLSRTVLLSLCFPVLLKTCNVTLVWPSWFAFKAAVRGREKKLVQYWTVGGAGGGISALLHWVVAWGSLVRMYRHNSVSRCAQNSTLTLTLTQTE